MTSHPVNGKQNILNSKEEPEDNLIMNVFDESRLHLAG